ncbi:hypothetical protein AB0B13_14740 [Streptomyces sp. NPDC042898]|uniref:hypothetical protein n=1 Tax=Streptomyces sp. NPDC042898 TaxID=3154334 RepID=UPI0033D234AB
MRAAAAGAYRAWPTAAASSAAVATGSLTPAYTDGPQRHSFTGPLLREVVAGTLPDFDPRRRKERSRFLLAVSGGAGHHAVLSWAEIDADFGDAPVLLATRMDDEALDEAGTQLVVPSDRCGARYVSAVTGIWIGSCRTP